MDASMYEMCSASSTLVGGRRLDMSLDLVAAASQRKCFTAPLSGSTHVDADKVTSPDLEAFLLYASASSNDLDVGDNSTSTPTQILFPKSVTAEQEAYARGFVDALEELHRRQGAPAGATPSQTVVWAQSSSSTCDRPVACWTSDISYHITTPAVHGDLSTASSPGSTVSASCDGGGVVSAVRSSLIGRGRLDDGAQTVPRLSCLTPPSSPDVDAVELARMDRKRERNRLAAQKCRSRKLEQIAELEARCAVLRAENDTLSRTAGQLSDDVAQLRRVLVQHSATSHCVINNTYPRTSR